MKNFISNFLSNRRIAKNADKLSYEFMPSALEIAETPASPLGSTTIILIFFIIFTFILWASICKVDVVAVSRGKIVPNGRVKIVQTLEEGIINNILVEEGERVKKGQVLLELDTKMKNIDKELIEKNLKVCKIEKELLQRYLDGADDASLQKIVEDSKLNQEIKENLINYVLSRKNSYSSKKSLLSLAVKEAENDLATANEELIKLENNKGILLSDEALLSISMEDINSKEINLELVSNKIDILNLEVDEYKQLFDVGLISEKEYLSKGNELLFTQKEYDANSAEIIEENRKKELTKKIYQIKSYYSIMILTCKK